MSGCDCVTHMQICEVRVSGCDCVTHMQICEVRVSGCEFASGAVWNVSLQVVSPGAVTAWLRINQSPGVLVLWAGAPTWQVISPSAGHCLAED